MPAIQQERAPGRSSKLKFDPPCLLRSSPAWRPSDRRLGERPTRLRFQGCLQRTTPVVSPPHDDSVVHQVPFSRQRDDVSEKGRFAMHQGQDDHGEGTEATDAVLLAFLASSSPYTALAVAACGRSGGSTGTRSARRCCTPPRGRQPGDPAGVKETMPTTRTKRLICALTVAKVATAQEPQPRLLRMSRREYP
jgi:hypothetical protein